ncbi:MAG: hypothetical protein AAF871_15520 [Pseudomonadota bacterium]
MTKSAAMRRERIDGAAFGVIYGTITVMALLMAIEPPISQPLGVALAIMGSVFAVALAKAFADICDKTLAAGAPLDRSAVRAVWSHSRTVLFAANIPALAFLLAEFGFLSGDLAYEAARIAAFGILGYYGARIGWRLGGSGLFALLSGAGVAGLGLMVSLLKYAAH